MINNHWHWPAEVWVFVAMIIDDDDVGVEAVGTDVDIEAVEDSPAYI